MSETPAKRSDFPFKLELPASPENPNVIVDTRTGDNVFESLDIQEATAKHAELVSAYETEQAVAKRKARMDGYYPQVGHPVAEVTGTDPVTTEASGDCASGAPDTTQATGVGDTTDPNPTTSA